MKNLTKILTILTAVILGFTLSQNLAHKDTGEILGDTSEETVFENLSPEETHQKIISERDVAIQKAKEAGDYRCCIHPPCTMCYMEANQWNNHTAGTCACDDLIAQGKDPCPQCERGLCESDSAEVCLL